MMLLAFFMWRDFITRSESSFIWTFKQSVSYRNAAFVIFMLVTYQQKIENNMKMSFPEEDAQNSQSAI